MTVWLNVVSRWVSNVDLFLAVPAVARVLYGAGCVACVALYDAVHGASVLSGSAPSVDRPARARHGRSESEPPNVTGVSEGGVTACPAAAARPDPSRLVLDASAGLLDPRQGRNERRGAQGVADLPPSDRGDVGRGRDGDIWLAGTQCRRGVGPPLRACASPAVARRYYETWADGLTAWDVLPAIHQPTLVLHRTDDRALPIKAGRLAAQQIAGQDGRAARR